MGDLGIKEGAAFNARNSHSPLETAGARGVPRGQNRPVEAGDPGRAAAQSSRGTLRPIKIVGFSLLSDSPFGLSLNGGITLSNVPDPTSASWPCTIFDFVKARYTGSL